MLTEDPGGGPRAPVSQLPQLALENCELEGLACTGPSVGAGGLSVWTSGEGPRPWGGGCESRGPPTDLSLPVEKGEAGCAGTSASAATCTALSTRFCFFTTVRATHSAP